MKIKSFGLSDVGRKRSHNEDAYLDNPSLGLFAVADGMGGHQAGEVASQLALDVLSSYVSKHKHIVEAYTRKPDKNSKQRVFDMLDAAVQEACRQIYEVAQQSAAKRGMGTTLSALLLAGAAAFIVHVGDSRIYLFRRGRAHQLTEDHTLLNEHLRRGLITPEQAKNFPHKNVITRAVGVMEHVPADTFFLELSENDRFLLCSDGLHGYFSDEGHIIEQYLSKRSLEEAAKGLIEFANQQGGKDNITALVLEVREVAVKRIDVSIRIDVLQQIPLFHFLEYQDLVRVVAEAETITVEPNQKIVKEGERGDKFYVILSGEVEISSNGVYITALGRGGHFGEMALIDDAPRSATVMAVKQTDLLAIKRSDFLNLINKEPKIASRILLNISRTLSERLRETTRAFAAARKQLLEKGTIV